MRERVPSRVKEVTTSRLRYKIVSTEIGSAFKDTCRHTRDLGHEKVGALTKFYKSLLLCSYGWKVRIYSYKKNAKSTVEVSNIFYKKVSNYNQYDILFVLKPFNSLREEQTVVLPNQLIAINRLQKYFLCLYNICVCVAFIQNI